MMTEDYAEWRRKLTACAVANFTACEALTAMRAGDRPIPWHEASDDSQGYFRRTTDLDTSQIARALGIDKRKRMEWGAHVHKNGVVRYYAKILYGEGSPNPDATRYYLCAEQGKRGTWEARSGDSQPQFRVTGHPTRDGAIEHIERLLGRENAK